MAHINELVESHGFSALHADGSMHGVVEVILPNGLARNRYVLQKRGARLLIVVGTIHLGHLTYLLTQAPLSVECIPLICHPWLLLFVIAIPLITPPVIPLAFCSIICAVAFVLKKHVSWWSLLIIFVVSAVMHPLAIAAWRV